MALVDDQIAIHYATSGLCVGQLYSHCTREPCPHFNTCTSSLKNTLVPKSYILGKWSRNANRRRYHIPTNNGLEDSNRITPAKNETSNNPKCTTQQASSNKTNPPSSPGQPLSPRMRRQRSKRLRTRQRASAQHKLYCVLHGEDIGHSTKDYPTTKEFKECMARLAQATTLEP